MEKGKFRMDSEFLKTLDMGSTVRGVSIGYFPPEQASSHTP